MISDISFGNIENMNDELAIKTNNFLLKLPPLFEKNQSMAVILFSGKSTVKKICVYIFFFKQWLAIPAIQNILYVYYIILLHFN